MHADKITHEILGSAFEVSNTLGCGFMKKVYERALQEEPHSRGLKTRNQVVFKVKYKNYVVGDYRADLIVEDQVIV